jgi:hypothetical protein
MASITDRCPTCGIDPRTVNPPDAVVALRSYPRRYRALLVRPDDEEGADIVTRRPAPDRWSALEHAAHVTDVLGLVHDAVGTIRLHDVPEVAIEPGPPRAGPVDDVVGALAATSERLAGLIGELSDDDWKRAGRLPTGEAVTILDLVRHAVHVGAHHRREIERVLREVR